MVGFVYDPTTKAKEGEEEPRQTSVLKKHIDPIDISLTELDELCLSFDDSSFDFDSIKDWIVEDPETYMAGLNPEPLIVDPLKVELGFGDNKEAIVDESKVSGNFGSLIEEEMGKVSLEGGLDGSNLEFQENKCEMTGLKINEVGSFDESGKVIADIGDDLNIKCEDENPCEKIGVSEDHVKNVGISVVGESSSKRTVDDGDDESESEKSESESESSSSGSSSSSSSDDDDDDDDDDENDNEENGVEEEKPNVKRETDMEDGEIRDSNVDEMVAWSDEEDEAGVVKAGPIMSKNELQVLPPVPPVNVTLQPFHQTSAVGVVLSIVGAQVIVEGVENHNPLNEGSILWITETRSPLGLVDEIFGPVKNPYYIVRYNSDSEVPKGIQEGTLISFVPEFVNHVLNNNNLYKKGYDASGENDEELSEELEFSDDEKEAEYKRMKKQMAKRESNDQNLGNRNGDKKKFKNKSGGKWKNDHQPSPTPPPGSAGPGQGQGQPPRGPNPVDQGNFSGSSGPVQGFGGGPGSVPPYRQLAPGPGFSAPSGGVWGNGIPGQQPQMVQQNQHFLQSGTSSGPVQGFAGGPTSGPMFPQLAQGPGFPASVSSGVWANGVPYQQLPGNGFPLNGMLWPQQNQPWQPYRPAPGGIPFQQQFNAASGLPPNAILLGGPQPNFGAGPVFATWHPNQNGFNQSQGGMGPMNVGENGMPPSNGMQPPGVNPCSPTWHPNQSGFNQSQAGMGPMNMGENGMQPSNGMQPPGVNPGPTVAPQNFSKGAGFGRGGRGFRGGGGRFGRGRGRQQSK